MTDMRMASRDVRGDRRGGGGISGPPPAFEQSVYDQVQRLIREKLDRGSLVLDAHEARLLEQHPDAVQAMRDVLVDQVTDSADFLLQQALAAKEAVQGLDVARDVTSRLEGIIQRQAELRKFGIEGVDTGMEAIQRLAEFKDPTQKTEREQKAVSVESPLVTDKIRRRLFLRSIPIMRETVRGIPGAIIYSSYATALWGEEMKAQKQEGNMSQVSDEELQAFTAPPGDFDVNVMSEEALEDIQSRLLRLPEIVGDSDVTVTLDHPPSQWRSLVSGVQILSGEVYIDEIIPGEGLQTFSVPFEYFLRTSIMPDDIPTQSIQGFDEVATLEGLEQVYEGNLEIEESLAEQVHHLTEWLTQQNHEAPLRSALKVGDIEQISNAPEFKEFSHLLMEMMPQELSSEKVRTILERFYSSIDLLRDIESQVVKKHGFLPGMIDEYRQLKIAVDYDQQVPDAEPPTKEQVQRLDMFKGRFEEDPQLYRLVLARDTVISRLSAILGYYKTKVPKRKETIARIRKMQAKTTTS